MRDVTPWEVEEVGKRHDISSKILLLVEQNLVAAHGLMACQSLLCLPGMDNSPSESLVDLIDRGFHFVFVGGAAEQSLESAGRNQNGPHHCE